jgi:hypothetical protein
LATNNPPIFVEREEIALLLYNILLLYILVVFIFGGGYFNISILVLERVRVQLEELSGVGTAHFDTADDGPFAAITWLLTSVQGQRVAIVKNTLAACPKAQFRITVALPIITIPAASRSEIVIIEVGIPSTRAIIGGSVPGATISTETGPALGDVVAIITGATVVAVLAATFTSAINTSLTGDLATANVITLGHPSIARARASSITSFAGVATDPKTKEIHLIGDYRCSSEGRHFRCRDTWKKGRGGDTKEAGKGRNLHDDVDDGEE